MQVKPVIISKITLTRPTQAKYNLRENDLDKLLKMNLSDQDKGNATVKIEFQQEREVTAAAQGGTGGRRERMFGVAVALAGHEKVNSGPRYKYDWVNAMNLLVLEQMKFKVGADVGELQNTIVYLLTEEYLTAEFRDGKIVSSPKRKGKGGNILTAEGKLIFQSTSLVSTESDAEFANFTYDDFVAYEKAQTIKFDGEILATEVPEETKDAGFFNDEFSEWIQEYYAEHNIQVLVSVK